LELLHQEQQRKRPRQGYSTGSTKASSSSSNQSTTPTIIFPCCLLQHPTFSLPMGSLTEIAGPAGAGKTQLALSLCVDVVMMECRNDTDDQDHSSNNSSHANNEKSKAVYVLLGGSGRFLQTISRRLQQMIQARLENDRTTTLQTMVHVPPVADRIHDCLTRIFVKWVCNTQDLVEMLRNSLPKLLQDHEPAIECVVLDGIASLFRFQEYECNKWHQERAATLFEISQLCRELSAEFQVPFVVINEATTRIVSSDDGDTKQPSRLEPALGLSWQQCVNSSFFVHRCSGDDGSGNHANDSNATSRRRRRLKCLRAPHIKAGQSLDFFIDRSGAVSVVREGHGGKFTLPSCNDGIVAGQSSFEF
jgi:RecA/RadA recombinase